jgi:phosphotransferase system HPr (HPr) family protein
VLESSEVVVVSMPAGIALHARPAGQFVKTANRYQAQITIEVDGRTANAKSILAVLALGAAGGTQLTLSAEGDDAASALDALAACVTTLTE